MLASSTRGGGGGGGRHGHAASAVYPVYFQEHLYIQDQCLSSEALSIRWTIFKRSIYRQDHCLWSEAFSIHRFNVNFRSIFLLRIIVHPQEHCLPSKALPVLKSTAYPQTHCLSLKALSIPKSIAYHQGHDRSQKQNLSSGTLSITHRKKKLKKKTLVSK